MYHCRIPIVNYTRGRKTEIIRKLHLLLSYLCSLCFLVGLLCFSVKTGGGYVPLQHVWSYRDSELPLKTLVTQREFLTSETNSELQ